MAKKFFYVCAGLFLLALTYHLGAQSAIAQAPSNSVVGMDAASSTYANVITANGDVYRIDAGIGGGGALNATYRGNLFGAATPSSESTWGQVKDRYRK
jgi:hypothetical protein